MNPRLFYLSNARLPTEKAHGYQILQMCQAFEENGAHVTLFHPRRENFGISGEAESLQKFYHLRRPIVGQEIPCIDVIRSTPFRLQRFALYLQTLTYVWNLSRRVRREAKQSKDLPILFLRDLPLALFLVRLLPKKLRERIVFELHVLSDTAWRRRAQIRLLDKFSAVICLSSAMRDRLIEGGIAPEKLSIGRDAVDLANFDIPATKEAARARLGIPAEAQIASYVGKFHSMGMEKGIPEILRSAKGLLEEFPKLLFYLVGGPLDRVAGYEKILRDEGLPRERFVFLEKQPVAEVPYYLKASDILLIPSPKGDFFALYSSPLKLFEYLSSKRPIIGSRLPALMEVLTDEKNSLLAEPEDPASLRICLRRLLQSPELGERLAENAYAEGKKFTWEQRAREVLAFAEQRLNTRKVTLISGVFPPDIGGPATYVPVMARELVRKGWDVQVFCLSDSLDHDDSKYEFKIIRIRRGQFRPWRILSTFLQLCRAAKQSSLFYGHGLFLEAGLAARLYNVPSVFKIVGDGAWERARNRGWFDDTIDAYQTAKKNLRLKLLDTLRTLPLRLGSHFIVPSEYLRNIVQGWDVRKEVQVIYNAVEGFSEEKAYPLPVFDGKTIVTICRLAPWKGVGALIEAIAESPGLRLIVIGDGPLRSDLAALARRSGCEGRVLLLGNLPREKVANVLRQSDLFILNSSYEGLPHVVLEAMEMEIPVLATRVGGVAEVVQSGVTGRLIPFGDPNLLKQAIDQLLADPVTSRTYVRNAKDQLENKFSFDGMVRLTEQALLGSATRAL